MQPRSFLSFLLIALIAISLRGAGITFGLDFHDPNRVIDGHQNDERSMAAEVRDGGLDGDLHPGVFLHWGSGGYLLFSAVDSLWLQVRSTLGASRDAIRADLARNLSPLLRNHRFVSLFASLWMIWLVAALVRREVGETEGWLAAFFLATCYLHAREGHFGTLDTLLATAITLAIDRMIRVVRTGRSRDLYLAAFFVGVGGAIKYSGALLGAFLPLAFILSRRRPNALKPLPMHALVGALLIAPLTFVAFSPQLFVAWHDFTDMLRRQSEVIGFDAAVVPKVLAYHARETCGVGFGIPALLLALVGFVAMLRRRDAHPLLIFSLAPFLLLLTTRTTAVRYGTPIMGSLAIWAAIGCTTLTLRIPRDSLRRVVMFSLALVAAAPSIARTVAFDRLLRTTDTRVEVIEKIGPLHGERSDVLVFGMYGVPEVQHYPFLKLAYNNPAWTLDRAMHLRPPFLINLPSDPFVEQGFAIFAPQAIDDYELLLDLDGRTDRATPRLPEPIAGSPHFFVPWRSPWNMTRVGPPIQLYRRRGLPVNRK